MKRVNIYIKESEDKTIDYLSELLSSNRSEIIRLAVNEFAESRKEQIDSFVDGLEITEEENHKYTTENIKFYNKCQNEPIFFAENAIKVACMDNGVSKIKLRDYQKGLLTEVNHRKRTITNHCRQSGISLIHLINILHFAYFNPDKTIAIVSNKQIQANESLRKLKIMYDSLPEFMKYKLAVNKKSQIQLDNRTRIIATTASSDSLRGCSYNYVFIDDAAFINIRIFDEFMTSIYPVIMASKTAQFHIASVPNGANHFMNLFTDSITNKINFYAMEIPYDVMPERDDEFRRNMIKQIGLIRFQQEFECRFVYRRGIEYGV